MEHGEKQDKDRRKNPIWKLKVELLAVCFPVVTHHGPTGAGKQGSEVFRRWIFEAPDSGQGPVDDHCQDENENQENLEKRKNEEKVVVVVVVTMTRMRPPPTAILLSLKLDGNDGSLGIVEIS